MFIPDLEYAAAITYFSSDEDGDVDTSYPLGKILAAKCAELETELARFKDNANKAFCVYCGHVGEKSSAALLSHVRDCPKNPWTELVAAVDFKKLVSDLKKQDIAIAVLRSALDKYSSARYQEKMDKMWDNRPGHRWSLRSGVGWVYYDVPADGKPWDAADKALDLE